MTKYFLTSVLIFVINIICFCSYSDAHSLYGDNTHRPDNIIDSSVFNGCIGQLDNSFPLNCPVRPDNTPRLDSTLRPDNTAKFDLIEMSSMYILTNEMQSGSAIISNMPSVSVSYIYCSVLLSSEYIAIYIMCIVIVSLCVGMSVSR